MVIKKIVWKLSHMSCYETLTSESDAFPCWHDAKVPKDVLEEYKKALADMLHAKNKLEEYLYE